MNTNRLVAGVAGRLYFYAYDSTTSLPYTGLIYSGSYSPKNSQQRVSGVWQSGNSLGSLTDGVNDEASVSTGKFIRHTTADPFGNLYSVDVSSSYITNSGSVDAVRLQLGASGINIVPYIHPIVPAEVNGAPSINVKSVSYDGFQDIFETYQFIESYPATGTPPTPAQNMMLSQQAFTEFAITGSNIHVKKLDGTTNAAIYAMNPSSTSRTRTS